MTQRLCIGLCLGLVSACGSGSKVTDAGADLGAADAALAIPPPTACPAAHHKTLVIVGDSISDVGSGDTPTDELPFYRSLLVQNDDARYPEWKGFDLATCWGIDPTTQVVKVSRGGAVATVPASGSMTDRHVLLNQVTGLPTTLAGPVLVVGTIGGNDAQAGLVHVLLGTAAQQQADVDGFTAGFGAAMAELTKTDRFGAGVKVDVLITNIYDPSGGTGHFLFAPEAVTCPGALGFWPDQTPTDPSLMKWDDAMAAEAAKYPGVVLLDARAAFRDHAVSTPVGTNWFHDDCIHPNATGHDGLRALFWKAMVALP